MSNLKYYVYVYIDPRTNAHFYYGKGKDDRRFYHLHEKFDSKKVKTINEIKSAGFEPLIRVVAKDLTEEQALLIEAALIWKSGEEVTNKVAGSFSAQFRKPNSLDIELPDFDYENGVYCINVGEGKHRCWEDCEQYGFISAGQNWEKWGRRISALKKGDVICAYLSRYGYVGIGVITVDAKPVLEFKSHGKFLSELSLREKNIYIDKAGTIDGEHVIAVNWIATKTRKQAVGKSRNFWKARSMLGSLENQNETRSFLEKEFKVSFSQLLTKRILERAG